MSFLYSCVFTKSFVLYVMLALFCMIQVLIKYMCTLSCFILMLPEITRLLQFIYMEKYTRRRYIARILLIRRKTQNNQSMKHTNDTFKPLCRAGMKQQQINISATDYCKRIIFKCTKFG